MNARRVTNSINRLPLSIFSATIISTLPIRRSATVVLLLFLFFLPLSMIITLHRAVSKRNTGMGMYPVVILNTVTNKNYNDSSPLISSSLATGPDNDMVDITSKSTARPSREQNTPIVGHNEQEAHSMALMGNATRTTGIPRILWLIYKDNILETNEPIHLYQTLLNTIAKYTESLRNQGNDHDVQVRSLNDHDCKDAVEKAYPSLVPHFLEEQTGMFRGDICRVAALYLHGSYYFDLDMEVHTPYIAAEGIESSFFVTSYDAEEAHFFLKVSWHRHHTIPY